MKIGFDAKWFFNGNPSGRMVVKNILERIIAQNVYHEIYVILNWKDRHEIFPFKNDKVKLLYIWGGINLISNTLVAPIILRKYKLDVCIFQYFAPVFCKYKKIVYIHDVIFKSNPEYFTLKERIYFLPMKYLAKYADVIITVSESEKKRIRQYHFAGSKTNIKVIYNGVDEKYKPQRYFQKSDLERIKLKFNLPEKFLLYVGRLNERKNISNLLKSIGSLNDNKIKLVLVGNYDGKTVDLTKKLDELGVNNRVLLLGHINDTELQMLYSLAYVFCYVSLEEGFGLPPLESLASGVPVVVSNIDSLQEVCGDAAVYCDPNDFKDIAKKIDMIISSENLRKSKIEIGIERAKKFRWEYSATSLMQCIEQAVRA
jgi:glycosyltransferase involved in cell wall biosynthesis